MNIQIGISAEGRKTVAEILSKLLANSYVLYLKTQQFHWNVKGANFQSLHALFEEQYTELATAVDEIAERIRALDFDAPGSFAQFVKLASIAESNKSPNAQRMVETLLADHEALAAEIREDIAVASEAKDEASVGLLAERIVSHEKTAWMLRSIAE